MRVTGFGECAWIFVLVKLDEPLTVPVASLPVLIALKLFAWMDWRLENNKDVEDIFTILKQYADSGNEDVFTESIMGDVLELAQAR